MTPLGIALTVAFVLGVLSLHRVGAALTVIAAVCYITQGQQFTLVGFHFTAIRLVLLAAMIRIVIRNEWKNWRLNSIDWALIAYASLFALVPCLRVGTSDEFVYRLGCAYDIFLSYWVFRGLLVNFEDVQEFLQKLALLIVPFALLMVLEALTGIDVFRNMGGVGYESDLIREGRFRCMGSFRGPITAGIFGGALIPLFAGLYFARVRRLGAIIGLVSATAIVFTSNSSGPLMAFLSGSIALLFWRWRRDMRAVRWGILAVLVGLHLCMKVPVWFILSKLSDLTGGDGWTRAYLIDQAIRHFSDWWLMGTNETADWLPTVMSYGQADMTDQYVSAGAAGGLVTLIFFVLIFVRSFRSLGQAMELVREDGSNEATARNEPLETEKILWCLGCALFGHVVTFFSVTYFDQLHVVWWGSLAMISSATSSFLDNRLPVRATDELVEEEAAFGELSPTEVVTIHAR